MPIRRKKTLITHLIDFQSTHLHSIEKRDLIPHKYFMINLRFNTIIDQLQQYSSTKKLH